jgi:hypothetical protein
MTARIATVPFRGVFPNPAKTSSGDFQVIEYTAQVPARWTRLHQPAENETAHPRHSPWTSDQSERAFA